MPKREDGKKWHPLTVAWWKDVWHSPMAREFLEVDRHALIRLAMLIDRFWEAPAKELAAEIRLEQQAFGLTPLDRRRLQWTVEQEEARTRTRQVPVETEAVDPRKILKVASG
jgi:hypothetical protein